jgi:hypothetical protein
MSTTDETRLGQSPKLSSQHKEVLKPSRGRPPKGDNVPKFDSRLQIKLTADGRLKLDELVDRMEMSGAAEVVRDALRLYDIVTEEVMLQQNDLLIRESTTGQVDRLILWQQQRMMSRDQETTSDWLTSPPSEENGEAKTN